MSSPQPAHNPRTVNWVGDTAPPQAIPGVDTLNGIPIPTQFTRELCQQEGHLPNPHAWTEHGSRLAPHRCHCGLVGWWKE